MAGSQPFDPSQLLTLVSGSRPNYLRLGGGSLCNAYLFDGSEADSLVLGSPFTGNLKVIIIAASETGINPAIVAGRQGVFAASTDPLVDMKQNQYEIDTVSFVGSIVDNTFTGRVAYAKEDVWYDIDMGASALRWYYGFDGIDDYITIPQVDLVAGDTIALTYNTTDSNLNRYILDTRDAGGTQYTLVNAAGNWQFNGVTLTINGAPLASGDPFVPDGLDNALVITSTESTSLRRLFINNTLLSTTLFTGTVSDIGIQAVSGNRFYAINDGPGAIEIVDSISGENGTPVNFNDPRWYKGV